MDDRYRHFMENKCGITLMHAQVTFMLALLMIIIILKIAKFLHKVCDIFYWFDILINFRGVSKGRGGQNRRRHITTFITTCPLPHFKKLLTPLIISWISSLIQSYRWIFTSSCSYLQDDDLFAEFGIFWNWIG